MNGILRAWTAIVTGRHPVLSIEITRECPLRCPGCYAYQEGHVAAGLGLRDVADYKGDELVDRVMALVRAERPVHVSIVGGEPLVRFRELNRILPRLAEMGIYTQVVTSAVRPIPAEWASLRRLDLSVSVDGLQPEHDARRKPATYERVLRHIAGHRITVHCTVTRQMAGRDGYLEEFVRFWSDVPAVRRIWMSLYTPQIGELSVERLRPEDRRRVLADIAGFVSRYPKLGIGHGVLAAFAEPPASPSACTFARITRCVSADLVHTVRPCQLGGRPDCAQCGCLASAGLAAVTRQRLPLGVTLEPILERSLRFGERWRRVRDAVTGRTPEAGTETGPAPTTAPVPSPETQ